MSQSVDYRHCPVCASKQLFEMPECTDGHGADCPDRACVQCGSALLVDSSGLPAGLADSNGSSSSASVGRRRNRTSAA